MFTFRSGANIGRLIIYSHHDAELVEELGGEGILGMISTVTKLSLLFEGLFLASLALSYKALSIALSIGGTARGLLLTLWLGGLAFGLAFGLFMARNNHGVLLKEDISLLAFFTIRKVSIKTSSTYEKLRDNVLKRLSK
ncbi:MAG: hypothetical protein PWQ79_1316 [Thermococcaceae archaeon]|nr:hypothetical protein [Thermococcaceae archaeon]MDK2914401.1 hypothetical protein [Thermococcaceae archaeon]